jgi:hypothetical protein
MLATAWAAATGIQVSSPTDLSRDGSNLETCFNGRVPCHRLGFREQLWDHQGSVMVLGTDDIGDQSAKDE